MMDTGQQISISLPAHEWLQIAGWLLSVPVRPAVSSHLLDAIGQTVLQQPV